MSTVHGQHLAATLQPGHESYRQPGQRATVRATSLNAEERRAVWAHIQATEPALAELLAEPGVAELRKEFGATPLFSRELVDAALASAGLPPYGR